MKKSTEKIEKKEKFFKHIVGYKEEVEMLETLADVLSNYNKIKELGGAFPKGLILKGSNGIGKTIMAKALIKASGLPCFEIKLGLTSENYDEKIGTIVEEARKASPSILFIDELDKLAGHTVQGFIDDDYRFEVLLKYVSELEESEVFILGTMNSERSLDKSLIRSGRIDKTIEIETPNENDRKEIFSYYLNKVKKEDINVDELAQSLSGCSCADIKAIVNEAVIKAFGKGRETVNSTDLQEALEEKAMNGITGDSGLDKEGKAQAAIHEAGHVVAALFTRLGPVAKASIQGRNNFGGSVRLLNKDSKTRPLEDDLGYLDIALGGAGAVERVLGTKYEGASRDYYKAMDVAKNLITKDGYLGTYYLTGDLDYEGTPMFSHKSLNEIEDLCHDMLGRADDYIGSLTNYTKPLIIRIAQELFTKKSLETKEIQKLFEEFKDSIKGTEDEYRLDELVNQRYRYHLNPYDVLFPKSEKEQEIDMPSFLRLDNSELDA